MNAVVLVFMNVPLWYGFKNFSYHDFCHTMSIIINYCQHSTVVKSSSIADYCLTSYRYRT